MKQYLLSVHYVDGQGATPVEEMEQAVADVEAFNDELRADGAYVFAGGLQTPDMSTVVREDGGQIVVTDGPFAEAKEQLGGFWVIRAADDAAARAWAERATRACRGPVEVRPFQDEPDEQA